MGPGSKVAGDGPRPPVPENVEFTKSPPAEKKTPEPAKDKKQEPVRQSTAVVAIAGLVILLCDKFGLADFTLDEGVTIVVGALALANEAARMKVWAPPKGEDL